MIDVDDAVAVEEQSAAVEAGGEFGLGSGEVGGDADVDEIAVGVGGAQGARGGEAARMSRSREQMEDGVERAAV
ncbi:MAG TPA: hypothetical protein VGH36_08330 [Acetobacteraceae bacterium]